MSDMAPAGNTPATGTAPTPTAAAPAAPNTAAPAAAAPASSAAPAAAPVGAAPTAAAAAPASVPGAATDAAPLAGAKQKAPEGQTAQGSQPDAASTDGQSGAPEKYEFKAPEGAALAEPVVAEFSAVAKELGLSQDAAQKVIDRLAPTLAKQNAAAISEAIERASTEWATATRSDKDIGGDKLEANLAIAKKALDRFGTPQLRALLGKFDAKHNPTGTGLGNHPELIRAFYRAGLAISEDKFVAGSTAPTKGERSAAKALYPSLSN